MLCSETVTAVSLTNVSSPHPVNACGVFDESARHLLSWQISSIQYSVLNKVDFLAYFSVYSYIIK